MRWPSDQERGLEGTAPTCSRAVGDDAASQPRAGAKGIAGDPGFGARLRSDPMSFLAGLRRPAFIEFSGGVLPRPLRERTDVLLRAICRPLVELVDAPVEAELLSEPPPLDLSETAFGIAVHVRGHPAALTLNRVAARSIVDRVAHRRAGLSGFGAPTAVESAILDLFGMLFIDALIDELGDSIGDIAMSTISDQDGFETWRSTADASPIAVRTRIAGRVGHGAVWLPAAIRDVDRIPVVLPTVAGAPAVAIVTALKGVDRACLRDARPGDFLALGGSDIGPIIAHAAFAASTGWIVADAVDVAVESTHIEARVGPIAPRPFVCSAGDADQLRLSLGSLALEEFVARRPGEGTRVALPFDGRAHVSCGSTELVLGEIVRLDGGLFLRIHSIERRTKS